MACQLRKACWFAQRILRFLASQRPQNKRSFLAPDSPEPNAEKEVGGWAARLFSKKQNDPPEKPVVVLCGKETSSDQHYR